MTPEPEMTDVGSPATEMAAAFSDAESDSSPGIETPSVTPGPPTNPDKYWLDGKEYTADQFRAWRTGGLLMKDWTRKTQKHAQERKAFEQQYRDAVAIHQALQEDPGLLKHLQGYYQQPEPTNGMEAEQRPQFDLSRDPMFRELRDGYRQLQAQRQEEQVERASALIDSQLSSLRDQFPSLDWDTLSLQLVNAVTDTGQEPEQLFWTKFRTEALKAHEDNLRRKTEENALVKKKAQVEPGGSDVTTKGTGKPTTKAERDAALRSELSQVFSQGLPDEE